MKTLMRSAAMALVITGAAVAPLSAMAQTAEASADSMFKATTLNLSAYGETKIAPDMATITLGVQTDAPTAAEALSQNAAKMNQVIAALKKGGIADRDIQTSNLSLNPQYVYQENLPPRLTGYQVSNQVTVRVRDLKRLGQAVDAVVGAGANNVGGISFGLSDPSAAENAARQDAVKALRAKAELYAAAAGYSVGRLVSLSENGGYAPPPPMPMVAMAAKAERFDSTPTAGGELSVRIDVNAVFELVK